MSEEAYHLLSTAPRREGCPYVLPSSNDPTRHLTFGEHYGGWKPVPKAIRICPFVVNSILIYSAAAAMLG
jgi:hypothetical protein